MTEEKITLDRDTFKTLASGTRIEILKSIDRRRKTLTELSKQFGMSVSTVKEHLDNLVSAGLIEQKDEGYKWKYYELTKKGKHILHPEDRKIWIILAVSVLGMIGLVYDLMKNAFYQPFYTMAAAPQEALGGGEAAREMGEIAADKATQTISQLPYFHIFMLIILGIVAGACLGYLIISRRRIYSMF